MMKHYVAGIMLKTTKNIYAIPFSLDIPLLSLDRCPHQEGERRKKWWLKLPLSPPPVLIRQAIETAVFDVSNGDLFHSKDSKLQKTLEYITRML